MEVDTLDEKQKIVDFLHENLTKRSDVRRFEWLYVNNPWGKARVWFAFGENGIDLLGVAAAFPRMVKIAGKDSLGWNLGDFVIRRDYRSLGPAVLLQKACLKPVLDGEIPFCYDHPSTSMVAIYKRLGLLKSSRVIRFVKPITVDRYIRKYLPQGVASRGISTVGNRVLGLQDRRKRTTAKLDIKLHEGRFDDEFTSLSDRCTNSYTVCGKRTADYLNWRYLDNPLQDFEIVTAREHGDLVGYGVLTKNSEDVFLFDIFADQSGPAASLILLFVTDILRQRRASSLSIPVIESSPLTETLKASGFFPRESADVVFCTRPSGPLDSVVNRGKNWFLTCGDRDI
jgi:hypothetical protein